MIETVIGFAFHKANIVMEEIEQEGKTMLTGINGIIKADAPSVKEFMSELFKERHDVEVNFKEWKDIANITSVDGNAKVYTFYTELTDEQIQKVNLAQLYLFPRLFSDKTLFESMFPANRWLLPIAYNAIKGHQELVTPYITIKL